MSISTFVVVRSAMEIVSLEFGVSVEQLTHSTLRSQDIVRPRHIVMWITHAQLGLPIVPVAKAIGGFNHTSVLHGCRRMSQKAAEDGNFAQLLDRLLQRVVATMERSEAAETPIATALKEIAELRAALERALDERNAVKKTLEASRQAALEREKELRDRLAATQCATLQASLRTDLIAAVKTYVAARARLELETYTRAEAGSRRAADDAFRALARAFGNATEARQPSAKCFTPKPTAMRKEPAYGQG